MPLSGTLRRHRRAVACSALCVAACLLTPCSGGAQVAYGAPTGRIEVLGLRHWTLAMLQDSIRRYVPGQELHDAACMVTARICRRCSASSS